MKINLQEWNKYLELLYGNYSLGLWQLGSGKLMFPNIALFTETDDHFILELLGATNDFSGLKAYRHKCSSTRRYLDQFDVEETVPVFRFGNVNVGLSTLLFSREADLEAVKNRFGFVADQWGSNINRIGGDGTLIAFIPNTSQFIYFNNCLLVNKRNEIYRLKYILLAIIASKKRTKEDYSAWLFINLDKPQLRTSDLYGVHYIPEPPYERLALAGQFANVFLLPELRETRIGEFLQEHPSFLSRALSCKRYLYNKKFRWIEGNPNPDEKYIQPDIMLEREDGYFDICDLKTALLDRKRMTKGDHSRRRFIDYVEEGMAQLANYEEYFRFRRNAEWAWSKYKVKVDHPKLILIVGSYENASRAEIDEAARKLKPGYQIIDYDTLNSLFLKRT